MHSLNETELRDGTIENQKTKLYGSYNGSTLAVKFLNACGWGPSLLNLGYFEWSRFPLLLAGLFPFQKKLVEKSIELLRPHSNETILDVACGNGWTTNLISQSGAKVIGVDLCDEHVESARSEFASNPNVKFYAGDATKLDSVVKPSSIDKVLCLEAAFHFGSVGRRNFLNSALRILKPGGILVLVDLTWKDSEPSAIEKVDPEHHFRSTWQMETFEPFQEYLVSANESGFDHIQHRDWTRPVLFIQSIASLIISLGQHAVFRRLLQVIRPSFAHLTRKDWRDLVDEIQLHKRMLSNIRYVAYEFKKPSETDLVTPHTMDIAEREVVQ